MKNSILTLFVLLFIYNCFGQNGNDIEAYKIINAAIEPLNEDKIYLYDSISTTSYNFWISTLTDSNVIQGTDSLIIKHYLTKPSVKQFFASDLVAYYQNNKRYMKLDSKYLTKNKQVKLFESRKKDIYPKYYISYPVLSLDKKYAWLLLSKHTKKYIGRYKINLFKKEKDFFIIRF